jgi:hypoxanthine phosphoribosyltransferase
MSEQAIGEILVSGDELRRRVTELGARISDDYAGRDLFMVGVLKGAVIFLADLMRSVTVPCEVDFMAVSSYGSQTDSSGVVRILKDLDTDITGRHVLIVEDIIDSGLTLSWIKANLESRRPASVEICTLLRKPEVVKVDITVKYVGFDIPNEFVVGYGLDYDERYRDLPYIGTLDPKVYEQA